jgi:hypothetical protein
MFPRHALKVPRHGEILWSELTHSRTLFVLHNPTYTGAFKFPQPVQLTGRAVAWRRADLERWSAARPTVTH